MKWDWWYLVWWASGAGTMGVFLWYWLIKPMGELLGFDKAARAPQSGDDT